jgi:hypothetical protein
VKDKPDFDKKHPALPSPGKMGPNRLMMNFINNQPRGPKHYQYKLALLLLLKYAAVYSSRSFLMVEW